jgi:hypothetical protein
MGRGGSSPVPPPAKFAVYCDPQKKPGVKHAPTTREGKDTNGTPIKYKVCTRCNKTLK